MAVDTPAGLMVPVIRDADHKGIWGLSQEILELATKAKERKLIETLADDLAQATFTHFPIPWIDLELKKFILPETRHISFQARFLRPKSKSRHR